MNAIEREQFELLNMTLSLRNGMIATLTDSDLAYQLPGDNPTFGGLLKYTGEVEQAYTDSFKTFKLSFDYRHADEQVTRSVSALTAWFDQLDAGLMDALRALTDEEIASKTIDRGDWAMPIMVQFHTFREAVLIDCGKVDVYLRALKKQPSEQWQAWIR
jgi:hypothetical protein